MRVRELVTEGSKWGKERGRRVGALLLLVVGAACTAPSSTSSLSASGSSEAPGALPPHGATAASSAFTVLSRGAHPFARADLEIGRLDPDRRIQNLSVVFKLSPEQLADRDALLAAVSVAGSPEYRKWLTPEDYAARFGATTADIARTVAWLTSQGLEVHDPPSPLRARVSFSGTVARLEAAFRTQMNRYLVQGETHYAMSPAPSIPSDLADIVLGIHNTHDFYPRPSKRRLKIVPDATCPPGGDCSRDGIAPPDWATIYDVDNLYNTGIGGTKITGAGVTIAIVGIAEISQADLTAFRTRYGLAPNPITMTLVPNTGAAVGDNGSGLEAVLDTEWSGAIAQDATINYVYSGANDADVDEAAFYAVEQNLGAVLSQSWASCEENFTPLDADIYENFVSTANTLGITYLASSGDDGAAACKGEGGMYVNLPAAFPGVTGVGGTGFAISGGLPFNATGNVTGYGIEAVWNEAHDAYTARGIAAGGGGISSLFARPTYQDSIATCASVGSLPTGVTPSSMRQVPDVSFTAATGESQYGYFIECSLDPQTNDCTTTGADPIVLEIGGTSASTPSFAGVIALANQATGGRLGNVNPFLYALNATTPSAFHDITTGNNEVTCEPGVDPGCPAGQLYGYTATPGYDCASGLGSIDATDLVTAWACSPITVCPTGDNCGTLANGCGGTVTCGSCTAPQTCGGSGVANVCGCSPITVCPTGDNCGTLPNGCGGTVTCGSCIAPLTCGGTGTANVCGCSPITVCPAGDNCGTVPNGCGGTVTCGSCTAPLTCGGTGTANVCGCSPITVCPAGNNCGTLPNGCGGTVTCGSCTEPQTCGGSGIANVCGCSPLTTCPAGDNCGAIPNGCGGTVTCGSCTAPLTCGGTGMANVCGCSPLTLCPVGDDCGSLPDGCGGTVSCEPGCASGQTCAMNGCVATPVDGGTGGKDSGTGFDSGFETGVDSGPPAGTDAGAMNDAASVADSGMANDSGHSEEGGRIAAKDSGVQEGSAEGGEAKPSTVVGCGCRTAKPTSTSTPALASVGVLFLLGGTRTRRRRRAGAQS